MGVGVCGEVVKMLLNSIVMIVHNSVNILKTTEMCTFKE